MKLLNVIRVIIMILIMTYATTWLVSVPFALRGTTALIAYMLISVFLSLAVNALVKDTMNAK